jgi:DNA-binding MarR family transcriptional regulator
MLNLGIEIFQSGGLIPVRIILSNMAFEKDFLEEEENLPLDAPGRRRRLPPLLRRAWYGLNQAFRRRVSGEGITPDQFTVLRWLVEKKGEVIAQRDLADWMGSDPNTIASLVKRMEDSKLLDRQVSKEDRRARELCVTGKGEEVYESCRVSALDLQTEVLSVLSDEEIETFLKLLEKVTNAASVAAEESRQ